MLSHALVFFELLLPLTCFVIALVLQFLHQLGTAPLPAALGQPLDGTPLCTVESGHPDEMADAQISYPKLRPLCCCELDLDGSLEREAELGFTAGQSSLPDLGLGPLSQELYQLAIEPLLGATGQLSEMAPLQSRWMQLMPNDQKQRCHSDQDVHVLSMRRPRHLGGQSAFHEADVQEDRS